MRALMLAIFALAPGIALASGFYMSPLVEAVFLLFFTPAGWGVVALLVAVLVALIVFAAKHWIGGPT